MFVRKPISGKTIRGKLLAGKPFSGKPLAVARTLIIALLTPGLYAHAAGPAPVTEASHPAPKLAERSQSQGQGQDTSQEQDQDRVQEQTPKPGPQLSTPSPGASLAHGIRHQPASVTTAKPASKSAYTPSSAFRELPPDRPLSRPAAAAKGIPAAPSSPAAQLRAWPPPTPSGPGLAPAPRPARLQSTARLTPSQHFDPRRRGEQSGIEASIRYIRIPSMVLARFMESYTNALCRKNPGAVARQFGVNRSDTCNFGLRFGYRHTWDRLVARIELDYGKYSMPDGNWVAAGESVQSADFLQLNLHLVGVSASILKEYPLGPMPSRWSFRVGGQLGVALLLGEVQRTKLGAQSEACSLQNLGDLNQCRPYRPIEFSENDRTPRHFADCNNKNGCNEQDLERAGRVQEKGLPPLVPVLNFLFGPRYAISPESGVALDLGIGMGVSVGLSVDYRLKWRGPHRRRPRLGRRR